MIVYHGTGGYALLGFLTDAPRMKPRPYIGNRAAFCTTTSFEVAALFALRKTPAEDFLAGKLTGIVLEFALDGAEGRDFAHAKDYRALPEEQEVAVFNPRRLFLRAVWKQTDGTWDRSTTLAGRNDA